MVIVMLIIGIIFAISYCIYIFSGQAYLEDEKRLKRNPKSVSSQHINDLRKRGAYETFTYVPKQYRKKFQADVQKLKEDKGGE